MKTKKSNLVYGAIVNYSGEINQACEILAESLKNSAFKGIDSNFKNEIEVQLHESLFSKAPTGGSRFAYGPALTTKLTNQYAAIGRLEDVVKKTDINTNEVTKKEINKLLNAVEDVAPILEEEDKGNPVRKSAVLALSKAYFRLKELLVFFLGKKREIEELVNAVMSASEEMRKKYKGLNVGAALASLTAAKAKEEEMEPEVSAYERKLKRGIIGDLLSKLRGEK